MIDTVFKYALSDSSVVSNGLKRAREKPDDESGWKFFGEFVAIRFMSSGKGAKQLSKSDCHALGMRMKKAFAELLKEGY